MRQCQALGMQQQSRRHGLHVGWRIEIVAEDRMTDRLQMHPQLV